MILREPMGWYAVTYSFMHPGPLEDFLRSQLSKPRLKVQARAAFTALFETYHPDVHVETIQSLEWDEHLRSLRTMVCLKIANVAPDEGQDRKQEMLTLSDSRVLLPERVEASATIM